VTNWHDYSTATRAALAALSRGSCYFPGCRTPILAFVGGRPQVNVEMAHIRGSVRGGPRFVAGMSDDARTSFANLLLLCVPHRKAVDRDEQAHPVDLLETWIPRTAALQDLRYLTEERLDDLLTNAFFAVKEDVTGALARFQEVDAESAELIRHLMDALNDQRGGHGGDQDVGGMLVQVLHRLTVLEKNVARLADQGRQHGPVNNAATFTEVAPRTVNIGWVP
jgi:hypothetical protein